MEAIVTKMAQTAIEMLGRPICTFVIHMNSYVDFSWPRNIQNAAHGDHIFTRMPIPDNEELGWRGYCTGRL